MQHNVYFGVCFVCVCSRACVCMWLECVCVHACVHMYVCARVMGARA